jgi:hypothetical protein
MVKANHLEAFFFGLLVGQPAYSARGRLGNMFSLKWPALYSAY